MFVRGIVLFLAAVVPAALHAQMQQKGDECMPTQPGVCARHVLQDEAGILTSPLHARPSDLLWLAPFGLATGVAIDYDAHAMRSLGHDTQRENDFLHVSDVGVYLPVAGVVAGYAAGAWRKDDYLEQTSVIAGEAMLDSLILNEGLKYAIDRETPSQGDETGRFWPHGPKTWPDGQSMPSNHAIITWSFAHVVANRYPGWGTRLAVYGLASTVSVSRVMARQHFPSDVLVGSTLGYLIGGYVANKRGEPSRSYSFSMVDTPNGRGVQLSYNFNH
ncbi:MAG TPA: phosphatase PAP2 family protein [Acidobacteriaceae bacterium]|jgi:hypothetical protein